MNKGKEIPELCIQCGFCCDGTLFSKAKMEEGDSESLKSLTEIKPFTTKDFFELPCPYFIDKCSVYDKSKPKVCGTFYCSQIKKFYTNGISYETVEQNIYSLKKSIENFRIYLKDNYPQFYNMPIKSIFDFLKKNEREIESKKSRTKYASLHLQFQPVLAKPELFLGN